MEYWLGLLAVSFTMNEVAYKLIYLFSISSLLEVPLSKAFRNYNVAKQSFNKPPKSALNCK